jgi:hypothetical protein
MPRGPIRGRYHFHLFRWRFAAQDFRQLVVDDFEVSGTYGARHFDRSMQGIARL